MRGAKFRPVLQMAQSDCAAACLAMVSTAYGGAGSLAHWRDALDCGRDGTTVGHLLRTARAEGMVARAFTIERDVEPVLRTAALPAILHVDGNHFVVVRSAGRRHAVVVDPRSGARRLTFAELDARSSGTVVVFEHDSRPVLDTGDAQAWGGSLRRLVWRTLRGLRLQLLAATALVAAATLAPATLMLVTVNHVLKASRPGLPPTLIGLLMACLGAQFLGTLLQSALVLRLQTRLDVRLMGTFVTALLAKRLEFLEGRAAGDVLSRIGANANLQQSLTSVLLAVGMYGPLTVFYAGSMLVISVPLALIGIAGGLLQGLIARFLGRRIEGAMREQLRADSEVQIHSVDAVTNYAIIKGMRLEAGVAHRWLEAFTTAQARSLWRDSLGQTLQASIGLIQLAVPITVVFAGGALYGHGEVRLGAVLAVVTLVGVFLPTVGRLVTGTQAVYLIRAHLERLTDVIGSPEDAPAAPVLKAGDAQPGGRAEIRLEKACFRYGKDSAPVVDGVSLEVAPGEMLGIAGTTGCGKTTLLHLMLGLYEPTGGTVRLHTVLPDGSLLPGMPSAAYVPQDPELFSGTVRDNILAWRDGIADAQVWDALEEAGLRADVEAMALRLDTPIGSRGLHLSGGQRQRLALARAFVGGPALLVADEPTSHLDPDTERHVLDVLRAMPCTRVIVAHGRHVLDACDRSVQMAGGRLSTELTKGHPR